MAVFACPGSAALYCEHMDADTCEGEPLFVHDGAPEGDCDHDYEPGWDYQLDAPPAAELLAAAINAAAQVATVSGQRFRVYAASLPGQVGELGRYCDGTQSLPVIVLDLDAHEAACERYGAPLAVALRTTIGHELGHACQERDGRDSGEQDAERYAADLEARCSD
jgi:hypothetical protein